MASRRPRVCWHTPGGLTLLTVARRGQEYDLGPRGLLTLEEAADALARPVSEVRRAIVGGFIPARRRGRTIYVTAGALVRFLDEERHDVEIARQRQSRIDMGRAKLVPLRDVLARLR